MFLAGGVHWGTVWTSVAALATAAAAIIALRVAVVETRRRNDDLERAVRADAALVTVTVDWVMGVLVARLTNHSRIPILDADVVKAEVLGVSGERGSVLPDAKKLGRGGKPLSAGGSWPVQLANSYGGQDGLTYFVGSGDQVVVTYQYLDARGQYWEREANREPRRLDEPRRLKNK